MLSGALGTYAAALIVVVASLAIGGGVLTAAGRREWSWAAPAVGLAAATVIAWWTIRLPGHGATALACLAAATLAGGALAIRRLEDLGAELRRGAPTLLGALVLVAIPFVVEGHFGVLGTGFNVDMSQHLFAADWLSDPSGAAPGLFEQGYPLGPHALAASSAELTGNLATAFTGVTIAAPALLALTALGACRELPWWRSAAIALLAGFAYLTATYLAQGSFKELFEATFLIGLAIWLRELTRGEAGWRAAIPPAVLGAGALYAYSAPGLAWLAGCLGLWMVAELWRRRERAAEVVRRALPAVAAGVVALVVLAAPELDRIVDFGGSVGTVSEKADATLLASNGTSSGTLRDDEPEFDNDLGNLFGQISPLEAFGVWPSGDFRVAPGDGAVPAIVFYLGALLGALGLAIGIAWAARAGETALLAALAAAIAIWLAARIASTPYTTAKALQMIAPVAMLISARGLLDPGWLSGLRGGSALLRAGVAAAFVAGAGVSGALALANAPVGPRDYSPGVTELSDEFAGSSTAILVPQEQLDDEHGEEFYGWELRRASSVAVLPEGSEDLPGDVRYVVTLGGAASPRGATEVATSGDATLYRVG